MADPVSAAGAVKAGSRYAALTQGARDFTGLVTQRSPYRDGSVPYLTSKFYGGSRFDSIWDGANREISNALTDRRRPGSAVYNSNTFPAGNSFASWKFIQNYAEIVRAIEDGQDGVVYDITAGQKSVLLTKAVGAGAGAARMLGVNTELFIGDGVDQKKVLRSAKTWQAEKIYSVGDFIVDTNGNLQVVRANPKNFTIMNVAVVLSTVGAYYAVITLGAVAPVMPANQTLTFSGLTTYVALNGQTVQWQGYSAATAQELNLSADQIAFVFGAAPYGPAADTGNMLALTGDSGSTGGTQPVWATGLGVVTHDSGVDWTNFGSPAENWGLAASAPFAPPAYIGNGGPLVSPLGFVEYWIPDNVYGAGVIWTIIDPNGNIQNMNNTTGGDLQNGSVPPSWAAVVGATTISGTAPYVNYGQASAWYAANDYGGAASGIPNPSCILDVNGNLQGVSDFTTANTSGATVPTWATTPGATTTDGAITWVCLGRGSVLWSGVFQYAYSLEGIDGTVSTASPVTLVANGGLGPDGSFQMFLEGFSTSDPQCKNIMIWRTAQGKPTLLLLDRIPNPTIGTLTAWTYVDVSSDLQLNSFISAPVAEAGDPPPLGYLPMCFALQRIWGVVDNMVVWSAGPDAVTGNGLTQFPPLNFIAFIGKPYAIFPITVQDGGQVVFTSSGIWIILGAGTADDPFYARPYFQSVNVNGYNAVTLFNQQFFVIESNLKVSAVAVQFPFNPSSGYVEVGFPIGDQFRKVTTGGYNSSLFGSAASFVSWNNQSTEESALYISDGAGHWFRMSSLEGPEQGLVWSPIATIAGGASAVQSVETSPGVNQLLIAPAVGTTGTIRARDDSGSVFTDDVAGTATPYSAWDAKGVTLLCSTGEWAEVAHIAAKSTNTGGPRPVVSVLLGEIEPSTSRPYDVLEITSTDPPDTPKSQSVYSDRYGLEQNGIATTSDCILVKFDYGVEAFGDELLDWGIYASVQDEREEPVSK